MLSRDHDWTNQGLGSASCGARLYNPRFVRNIVLRVRQNLSLSENWLNEFGHGIKIGQSKDRTFSKFRHMLLAAKNSGLKSNPLKVLKSVVSDPHVARLRIFLKALAYNSCLLFYLYCKYANFQLMRAQYIGYSWQEFKLELFTYSL